MRIFVMAFFAAIALTVAGCGESPSNIASNTTAQNSSANAKGPISTPVLASPEPAKVMSGKDLYTTNCMTCHKDSGKGGKVTVDGKQLNPDDLTSASMKAKTDEKLYSYISDGIEDEGMPSFKDKMTPDEIRSVVAHVRELQK